MAQDPPYASNPGPPLTINTLSSVLQCTCSLGPGDLTQAVRAPSLWPWECPFPVEDPLPLFSEAVSGPFSVPSPQGSVCPFPGCRSVQAYV